MCKAIRRICFAAMIIGMLLGGTGRANADLIYTLATDAKGDSATADFKIVAGGIEVIVTNTGSTSNTDSANAISQIVFTVNTAKIGLPTSFTELSGHQITYASHSSTGVDTGFFDFKPPSTDPNLHWSFGTSGSTVNLVDVSGGGLAGPGGQPQEMIVPLNATTGSNSLSNFNPSFNGTANFFLADSTVPSMLDSSVITGVKFSFGTTPEDLSRSAYGSGTSTPGITASTPEPASVVMLSIMGLAGIVGYTWRRRRQLVVA